MATLSPKQVTKALAKHTALPDAEGDFVRGDGEPYLDIVEVKLALIEGVYVCAIRLAGDVPSRLDDPELFIEWDLMIDADRDPSTAIWPGNVEFLNDLGVEYMVRLCLKGGDQYAEVFTRSRSGSQRQRIGFHVVGSEIRLLFLPSHIGGAKAFDFLTVARLYGEGGLPHALLCYDKTPEDGHYTRAEDGEILP